MRREKSKPLRSSDLVFLEGGDEGFSVCSRVWSVGERRRGGREGKREEALGGGAGMCSVDGGHVWDRGAVGGVRSADVGNVERGVDDMRGDVTLGDVGASMAPMWVCALEKDAGGAVGVHGKPEAGVARGNGDTLVRGPRAARGTRELPAHSWQPFACAENAEHVELEPCLRSSARPSTYLLPLLLPSILTVPVSARSQYSLVLPHPSTVSPCLRPQRGPHASAPMLTFSSVIAGAVIAAMVDGAVEVSVLAVRGGCEHVMLAIFLSMMTGAVIVVKVEPLHILAHQPQLWFRQWRH
ncbi:hypothetical protein K438DRAFT_2096328 [Mycena galopus ATCC 62051]|nr:hypothetical protein K438DRAFT_2096328 [Mycena galopus ATCC 62051]